MFRSVVFIVNPVAGSAKAGPIVAELRRRLRDAGGRTVVCRTQGAGHAMQLARSLGGNADLIVAVGGDGTTREVAEGCVGHRVPIALLPAGTENLVARHLGYELSAECLWSCIVNGRLRPVDVGVVNGRFFLLVIGAGFDAEVVRGVARARRGHISRSDYFWPMWRTFWEYRFPPVRVIADQQVLFEGPGLVMVGNVPLYAMGLRILRDARTDDGLLDVCIYPCRGQSRLLVHSFFTAIRRHVERRDVIYRKAREIRIDSSVPVALEVDGDCAGTLPAEVSVLPARAIMCVPPGGGMS